MKTSRPTYKSIDEYIAAFPEDVRKKLEKLRKVIHAAAPRAEEAIAYGIPTFKLNGNLVHFGAFKDHISFFPTSSPIPVFKKELAPYKLSKGTIQFPLDRPIPFDLVRKIVKFRVRETILTVRRSRGECPWGFRSLTLKRPRQERRVQGGKRK